jgi:hypothetical protein
VSAIDRMNNLYVISLGASLAFWFAYYVLEAPKADFPAVVTGFVWVAALFSKMWLEKKEKLKQNA